MTEWLRSSRNLRREWLGLGPVLPGLAVVGLHSDGVAAGGMMPEHTGTEVIVHGLPAVLISLDFLTGQNR